MELPDQPETLEQLLVDCRDTLKYGVRTGLCVCERVSECGGGMWRMIQRWNMLTKVKLVRSSSLFFFRSPSFLQPAVLRSGCGWLSWRVVDIYSEQQHVIMHHHFQKETKTKGKSTIYTFLFTHIHFKNVFLS